MKITKIVSFILCLFFACSVAGAQEYFEYTGNQTFGLTGNSNVDVLVEVFDGTGAFLTSSSDNNIPLTGHVDATLYQGGSDWLNVIKYQGRNMDVQTTRGLDINLTVSGIGVHLTSSNIQMVCAGTGQVLVGFMSTPDGDFTIPFSAVNAYGNIHWSAFFMGGDIPLADYNPHLVGYNGHIEDEGNDFVLDIPMAVAVTQNINAPIVGALKIKTTITADIEGLAPIQTPEPATILTCLLGGVAMLRREKR